MMVDVRQNGEREEAVDDAAAFARLADASAKLFAEQAGAMAVMTAFGMSVAGQMTGLMLGAFRTAEGKTAETQPEEAKAAPVPPAAEGKVVPLRPQAPVAEAKAEPVQPETVTEVRPAPAGKQAVATEKKAAARPAVLKPAAKPGAKVVKAVEAKPAARTPVAKGAEARPTQDDLKKISGIGPRLEKVLNDRGVLGYADIARLSASALKKIDAELDLDGRVIRDDWAGQAKALLAGRA
jgi:NADH-quinone oxidoreductase subunit E